MKKRLKELPKLILIILIIVLPFVAYLLITKFIIKPVDDLNDYIDTKELVQIDFPLDYNSKDQIRYYVVSGDEINPCIDIINNGIIYDTYNDRWLKAHKYDRQDKTVTFHYSDGTKEDIIFYGPGTSYFKISDGKYGYARYRGSSLAEYIYGLHSNKLIKNENGEFDLFKNDFKFEDIFGEDYDKPFCGY